MEDIVIFVFSLAVSIALIIVVANASLASFYKTAQAEKKVMDGLRSEFFLLTDLNGAAPTEHILYITRVSNGEINAVNVGFGDIYSLRLLCWDVSDPKSTLRVVLGDRNGEALPVSVDVLTPFSPTNVVEYNLVEAGFQESSLADGNVECVVVTGHFIKGFVPR